MRRREHVPYLLQFETSSATRAVVGHGIDVIAYGTSKLKHWWMPLKILIFILVDGWSLLLKALVGSFH